MRAGGQSGAQPFEWDFLVISQFFSWKEMRIFHEFAEQGELQRIAGHVRRAFLKYFNPRGHCPILSIETIQVLAAIII